MINGDGLQTRDYVFVGDVVRANLAALGRPGFGIFNVGTGVETDVNTLYRPSRTALGEGPEPAHGPPAAGEQRRSSITSARLERELGVRVATPSPRASRDRRVVPGAGRHRSKRRNPCTGRVQRGQRAREPRPYGQ